VLVSGNNSLGTGTLNLNGGTIQSSGPRNYGVTAITLCGTVAYAGPGSVTFNAPIDLGSIVSTFSNNKTTGSLTFNGVISGNTGGGLTFTSTKTGTVGTTLTAANTYTGATTISASILALGSSGSLASTSISVASGATFDVSAVSGGFTLASGQTLGGAGTIAGPVTVASGGIIAPGNSLGTLTFNSDVTLNTGSILNFELGTTSDLIAVTGTLTGPGSLHGATINFSNSGGFSAGTYTLINYTSATLSNFQATDFTLGSSISGYTYNLALSGNALQLTATASAIPEPSTYALLAGCVALGLVVRRRRGRLCS
jgi:autotransporter-associated beta strand protein